MQQRTSTSNLNTDFSVWNYPFGMLLPNRNGSESSGYEYGFNGMRKDDEIKNQAGTSYDFGARMYDPRVGRFLSVDAFVSKFAFQSPYTFSGNTPIWATDNNGDSVLFYSESGKYLGYSHDNMRYKNKNLLVIIDNDAVSNFKEQYEIKRSAEYTKSLSPKQREAHVAGLEAMGTTFDISNFNEFYDEYKDKGIDPKGNITTVTGDKGYVEFGATLSNTNNPIVAGKKNWKTIEEKNIVTGESDNHIVWDKSYEGEIHIHTPWLRSQPSPDDWHRQEVINKENPAAWGIVINGDSVTFYKNTQERGPEAIVIDNGGKFENIGE